VASDNERPGAIARFFGSLTNALLDVGLPAIRAWLRDRVGPDADIAQITNEGSFVHLDGVRIPVGPRGLVVLERATAKIVSPTKIRIHAFKGGIAFGTEKEASFVADIAFVSTADADDDAWVSGDLAIMRASWTNADGRANPPMDGRARLFVAESTWQLETAELRGEQAVARFSGHGTFDAVMPVTLAGIALEKCRVGPFVDAAAAIGGKPFALPAGVPLDALLEGTLAWEAARGGECNLHVSAEAGALVLRAAVTPDGKSVRGRIEGTLRPHVPLRAGGLEKWAPREEDTIAFAVDIEGETTKPAARGTFRADAIGFRLGRARYVPATTLHAIEGKLEGEGDALRIALRAAAGHGSLALDLHGNARDVASLRGVARVDGVDGSWLKGVLPALGVRMDLPPDMTVAVDLAFRPADSGGLALTGKGRLLSPRSEIAIDPLEIRGGDAAGTRAKGRLAAADLLATGVLDFSVRPEALGELALAIAVETGNVARAAAKIPEIRLRVLSRPDLGPFVLSEVEGRLALDAHAFRYENVVFRAYGGRFVLGGTIPFGDDDAPPRLVAHFAEADGSLVRAGAAFANVVPKLPEDLRVSGELRLFAGGALASDLAFETPNGTALLVYPRLSRERKIDGSRLKGVVAAADVLTVAGIARGAVDLRGHARVDADAQGLLSDPTLAGVVTSDHIAAFDFDVSDVSALVHLDARRLAWNHVEATAYDGSVGVSGILGFGPAFTDLYASIQATSIAVEKVPGASGAVAGRLSATLDLVRGRSLRGRGEARLVSPAYPVLESARPALQKYGLVPPPARGIVPATAVIELGNDGVRFTDVRAAVPGCSVVGNAIVGFGGSLRAVATATLDEDFLASSPMLVLPKVLAERLTLPVRLSGTLSAPLVHADLGACLGRFVRDNRVSAFVTGAVEEVAFLLGRELPPSEPDENAREPSPRAPDDVGERLRGMLATAADWDQLAARLDERRHAGSRFRIS
jgi:hypothetical protein